MNNFSLPKLGTVVRDIEGRRYKLEKQLSQGRQGAIYTIENQPDHLIKIRLSSHSGDYENSRRHLQTLTKRKLEIDSLVLPLAILAEPYLGYIMKRVENGVSLSNLIYPKTNQSNWYIESGGLRRRLRICEELARAFLQIHRNGLCYVDLSWENVLISENPKLTKIRLIDPDNLIVPGTSLATVIGSPSFIAPELLKDESRFPNQYSDCWSLAVIIYYILVLNHPFLGDEVLNGDPDLEEQAFHGELPFIDSKNNNQNRSSKGLPRGKVLTRKLQNLFQQTFEEGIFSTNKRPDAEDWLKALQEAGDQTVICEHCGGTSYLPNLGRTSKNFVCDWCSQTNPRPIELGFFDSSIHLNDLDEGEKKELQRHQKPYRFVLDKEQRYLPLRLVNGDIESTGYAAQFGYKPNINNQKVYALKNLTNDVWSTKDRMNNISQCNPNDFIRLEDETLIILPSKRRIKVRNLLT